MIPDEVLPPRPTVTWLVVAATVWVLAAVLWHGPEPMDPAEFSGDAVVMSDLREGAYGPWAVVESESGHLLARFRTGTALEAGDVVRVIGSVRGEPGQAAGLPYRAVVRVRTVEVVGTAPSVVRQVGSGVRSLVMSRLDPLDSGRALLAGFLIGEISGLSDHDEEAMRRSGLAHFVAVSGSNVALVLVLVYLAVGPLALGPKRRAVAGLLALPIYAAATRFEPSVLRASVMAGLALGGRVIGLALHPWQLLSAAVILLLVLEPALTASVGFQMSVAATAGVMVGARWPISGGKVMRALAVTIGAQLAVGPLLLTHFGTVPLLSPLANLMAAPLVAVSTLLGAVGIAIPGPFIGVAAWLADLVLRLARGASAWPQLGLLGFSAIALAALVAWRWRGIRLPATIAAAAALVAWVFLPAGQPPDPGIVILDVGQGDSILIHSQGKFALVDGGPDELLLADRLRSYGVDRLEFVVLTHVHADHATGLLGVIERLEVGQIWADLLPHNTATSSAVLAAAKAYGVPVMTPPPGHSAQMGDLRITVEGPLRRYASPNDQSIVLLVEGPDSSALLSGDIETFAQADLEYLRADVLKVPHQGGATSDPDWLRSVGATLAVISVGPNQFGHPASWVVEVLQDSGARVMRTDIDGDVPVPLGAG